ncbi:hypothetical protein [Kutzneria kofuensis]
MAADAATGSAAASTALVLVMRMVDLLRVLHGRIVQAGVDIRHFPERHASGDGGEEHVSIPCGIYTDRSGTDQ